MDQKVSIFFVLLAVGLRTVMVRGPALEQCILSTTGQIVIKFDMNIYSLQKVIVTFLLTFAAVCSIKSLQALGASSQASEWKLYFHISYSFALAGRKKLNYFKIIPLHFFNKPSNLNDQMGCFSQPSDTTHRNVPATGAPDLPHHGNNNKHKIKV